MRREPKAESLEKGRFSKLPEIVDMSRLSTGSGSSIMSEGNGLCSHTDRSMDKQLVEEIAALHKKHIN